MSKEEVSEIDVLVRKGITEDSDDIVRFQQVMAFETEGKVLNAATLKSGVAAMFSSYANGFYLVAEGEGKLIGSLLITYEWSDWRNATYWWIQSVFVLPEWRRKGIYRSMHDYVLNIAVSRRDICGIRLYVDHGNEIAQRTYMDLGMVHSNYDLYEMDVVF